MPYAQSIITLHEPDYLNLSDSLELHLSELESLVHKIRTSGCMTKSPKGWTCFCMGVLIGHSPSKLGVRWRGASQDLLVQRSSDTLRALAELDAAELKRYRQNALMWQVTPHPSSHAYPTRLHYVFLNADVLGAVTTIVAISLPFQLHLTSHSSMRCRCVIASGLHAGCQAGRAVVPQSVGCHAGERDGSQCKIEHRAKVCSSTSPCESILVMSMVDGGVLAGR